MKDPERNLGIDLLRGLSILYIVGVWHMFFYTKACSAFNGFLSYRLMLIVLATFVFISGYFIGRKHINSAIAFYKKRLIRIYPLYLIAICLYMFFNLSDMVTSFKAGVLVSMIIKPAPNTLWFITMLFIFYFITPLLIYLTNKLNALFLTVYYLVFVILLLAYSYITEMLDMRLIMYFPSFALGVFVANKNINIFNGFKSYHNIVMLIILFISVLISFIKTPYELLTPLMKIPMITLCAYFLFRVAKGLVVSSDKIRKIITFLSYSSYCMYLFHHPIYISLKNIYWPDSGLYQVLYLVLIGLPCILCFSFVVQKTFDFTVDKLSRNSIDPPGPGPGSLPSVGS